MIAVVNMGPHRRDPMGWRNYEVRINREVIARFRHKRSDGLERCLLAAAKAVRQAKEREADLLLEMCQKAVNKSDAE